MDKTERGREGKRAHVYKMEYAHVDPARGKGSPHSPSRVGPRPVTLYRSRSLHFACYM